MRKMSFRGKFIVGFAGLGAAILVLGGTACLSLDRIMESDRWVDHTTAVIDRLQELHYNLQKCRASYGGYLLLRDPTLLQTAASAMNLAYQTALDTQVMTGDNQSQKEHFDGLIALLSERSARFRAGKALCLAGRFGEALAAYKDRADVRTREKVDKLLTQMIVEERNLLAKRREAENRSGRDAVMVLILGGVLASLFAFAALLVIVRDVRERDRMQQLLQLNEYQLFQFLEAVPVGIFIAEASGKPYYLNQVGKSILGRDLVPGGHRGNLGEVYQAYLRGTDRIYPSEKLPIVRALNGEKCSVEDLEIPKPDGTIVPLEVWATPVTNHKGWIIYGMTVFTDIADRRSLELMKESLVSVIAHQLKTPVGEINGYVENMLEGVIGDLNPKQREYLMDIREIGLDSFQMISSFLTLSRLERGILRVELSPMSLEEIFHYAMRDYEKIIARKGLKLVQSGFDEGLRVMADREKIVECLRNLVNNAVKFTEKGSITLEAEPRGEEVVIRIRDTGPGLSDAAVSQLFSQKRVLGTEAAHAGAGLGLYIVKKMMDLQGGSVAAESENGKGTCFTLTLKRVPVDAGSGTLA